MVQQQGDQHPPQAAVAVEVGVDGLELDVRQRDTQQRRQVVVGVDIPFKITEQIGDLLWWRRHKHGIAGAAAPDPVLRAAQLAWLLGGTAHALHQDAVALVEQAHGDRRAFRRMDLREGMIDRSDVVGDLLDVVKVRGTGLLGLLPGQHVDQRRLGAFDLRGQQGLPDAAARCCSGAASARSRPAHG